MNIEKLIKMTKADLLVLQEQLIDTKQPEDFNDEEKLLMENLTSLLYTNNPCICSLCNSIQDLYVTNINKDNKNICDGCVFKNELFEEIEKYSENFQKQMGNEEGDDEHKCSEMNIENYCKECLITSNLQTLKQFVRHHKLFKGYSRMNKKLLLEKILEILYHHNNIFTPPRYPPHSPVYG